MYTFEFAIDFSALRTERSKLKEEKNIMRQIYQELKNEINRVQKLQGEVTGISIEANRLAVTIVIIFIAPFTYIFMLN